MSGRPSIAQLEALVEFLEQNPGIAKGQLRTTHARQETKRKWTSLATTLNALGGASKDGVGWAKYWSEKKCALKKQCSERAASMRRTGGGIDDNLTPLSPLDLRLVEVMGGRGFAVRDSQLAVEPFPQSSQIFQTGTPAPSNETDRGDIVRPSTSSQRIIIRSGSPIISTIRASPLPQPIGPMPTQSHSQPIAQPVVRPTPAQSHSQPIAQLLVQSPRRDLLRSPRRPRRVRMRPSSIPQEMDRMARLEESRVAAETVTAQAFANAIVKLDQLSEAVREGATTIANALLEIARSIHNIQNN